MTQPEPVHGYTEPEIVAAEEQFDALINAGITAAVAAAVAAILAEPITSTVTDAIFAPIFTLWNTYTAEVLVPELTRVFLGSGEMFLDTLAGKGDPAERVARLVLAYDIDEDLPLLDEPAAAWMAGASNRLKNVGTIVWEEIREQLVEGIKAGDGIPELAARVEQAAGFSSTRAVKTARTEVAAASNGGAITQARALGLDMDKQWEATFPTDGRTRPTHIAAHHQTVPLDGKFVVGDSLLDFPADPLGEADETINCRCAWTAVNIRQRAETLVVAAGFDEAEHPRDGEGKFAEQAAEDLGVLASIGDAYGPIEHELEWGDQSSGSADPVYGWLTIHENGDSVLSVYSEEDDTAKVVLDSGDSSAWSELADRIERVQTMWENSAPGEGEDERQALGGLGTGTDGDIGVAYDKDGLINLYMTDPGQTFDIWLDGDETSSLLGTLEEAARLIDEAQEDDEDDVDVEISAAVIHFVESEHPRGHGGKFARKAGHTDAWIAQAAGALRGAKALDSAPVQLAPDKEGHSGRYGNAELRGIDDDAVKLALSEMEGVEYADTNGYLRRGDKEWRTDRMSPEIIASIEQTNAKTEARVNAVDRGMDASPLPEDVVVHRGIKNGGDTFGNTWYGHFLEGSFEEQDEKWPRWEAGERPDLTGLVWEELAYTHTTVIDGRLKGYARKIVGQDPVAMNILVPKGTKGVQMSGLDAEGELMLERGLKYRVVKDHGTDENGVRQWDVEVIPND